MRTAWKRAVYTVAAILIGSLALTASYFRVLRPRAAPAAQLHIEVTPARLARGAYIFNLADCDGCHSARDFSRFGGPVISEGRGVGVVFPKEMGLPGFVASRNITPDPETGIGGWTDGEKVRAIREGISRDGHPLFPMMPYQYLRHLSDEDVYSLVVYLNSLPPVKHRVPETRIEFPVSWLMRTEPTPAGPVPAADPSNAVRYGEYLVSAAGCLECHTMQHQGQPVDGMWYAGGREFRFPFGRVVSANITPDLATGIGKWKEADFLSRIYEYREYAEQGPPPVGPEGFTLMPWLNFSRLRAEDLKAIYAYLRTRAPVYHPVETHPPALVSDRPASGGRPRG